MIKKTFIALFFFVFAAFSILAVRGRLLYLDATTVAGEAGLEAKLFHIGYLTLLVLYLFFTYVFIKTAKDDDNYRKVLMGMALPLYVLGAFGVLAGIGCGVLGCTYGAEYDPILGALLNLEFLDRFFGDQAEVLYKFTVRMPL